RHFKLLKSFFVHKKEGAAIAVQILHALLGYIGGFHGFVSLEGLVQHAAVNQALDTDVDDRPAAAHNFLGLVNHAERLALVLKNRPFPKVSYAQSHKKQSFRYCRAGNSVLLYNFYPCWYR